MEYSNECGCHLRLLSAFFTECACVWLVHVHLRCVKIHFHWNDYTTFYTCMRACVKVYELILKAIRLFRKLSCSFHCRNAEIFVNGGKNSRYRNFAIILRFAIPFRTTDISKYTLSIVTKCSLTFQLSYLWTQYFMGKPHHSNKWMYKFSLLKFISKEVLLIKYRCADKIVASHLFE